MIDPSPSPAADTNPTPHTLDTSTQGSGQRKRRVRTRNRLKHHYLCISVIIRSSQLSAPLSPQEPGSETIFYPGPVSREREREREREVEARENWEWQKLETETLIKAEHVSPGREHYWCDFRFSHQVYILQIKFNCCGGVLLCCCSVWLCCGRVSSLYCIDCLEAEDRSQASPPAAHCSQFSVQKTRSIRFYLLCIIVEMSSFRIVIKLCIKYNVTIIAPDNTCITSDNIETKRNCHLTRNLNIENIGMFCNYLLFCV